MNHISKTQIGSYLRCPFAYHCRYILGIKIPPSSAITLGKCFDFAVNVDYENKIKTGKDEPMSVVADAFATTFDTEKGNTIFAQDEKPEQLKDNSIPAVKKFYKEICTKVMPAQVQVKDSIEFVNTDYSLDVVVDCIEHDGTIIDNKFKRRSSDMSSSLDAPLYIAWYRLKYNKSPKQFSYDIAVATKEPKVERVVINQQTVDTESVLRKIAAIKDSIEHDTARGCFFPNTSAMTCSRRHCGYWNICEEAWKHTIRE